MRPSAISCKLPGKKKKGAAMADDATKKLEMRIVELENTIRELAGARPAPDISPAELQTYLKVKGIIESCPPCIMACLPCLVCNPACFICLVCSPWGRGGSGGTGGGPGGGFGSLGG